MKLCRPFMSRTAPVTPYGLASVTLTSLLEIPGCIIETFEPVSKIRFLDMPSIQTEINGVPHSNAILTGGLSTAFSGTVRRKELPSFTPRCRFPKLWPPVYLPASQRTGAFPPRNVGDLGLRPGPFFSASPRFLLPF